MSLFTKDLIMNILFLSPHFPPEFYLFCKQLHSCGVTTLGLADVPYGELRTELQESLTEYNKVSDLHHVDELRKALDYFTNKYGKIDRLDSLNEYWLETESRLRSEYDIPGLKLSDMERIKTKSGMKEVFSNAGIPVAPGKIIHTPEEAEVFLGEIGFPVVAKPDNGVGAVDTFKISSEVELRSFFENKPDIPYFMEQFIEGTICSFDGLADADGIPLLTSSFIYGNGVMEAVNEDTHIYYHTVRDIPADLDDLGRKVLSACNVRERFFHIEFFRRKDGQLLALEANIRPPGGLSVDMINFTFDCDLYREWALLLSGNPVKRWSDRKFYCAHIGRKDHIPYKHDHQSILREFGESIVHHRVMHPLYHRAMGKQIYLVRSETQETLHQMISYIHG